MSALTIHQRPTLRRPILVLAFRGWNDGAEAASGAVRHLRRQARSKRFAEIDPDEFFVFTEDRPHILFRDGVNREIQWPTTDFTPCQRKDAPHDLILGLGTEPHLRWRTFAALILEFATALDVHEIVTLGGLLADTPHTRPIPISGSASDPDRAAALGLTPTSYEGPTGIVGTLADDCRRARVPHLSLWAAVPHYVAGRQNPRASQTLLQQLDAIYSLHLDLAGLDAQARRYEAEVSEAVQGNAEISDYVQKLEAAQGDEAAPHHEQSPPTPPLRSVDILAEVDRLLHRDEPAADNEPDADDEPHTPHPGD